MSYEHDALRWIASKAGLPNGVTIEYQAWDAKEHEWREASLVESASQYQYFITWGAKLGHFANGETLPEAFLEALRRDG